MGIVRAGAGNGDGGNVFCCGDTTPVARFEIGMVDTDCTSSTVAILATTVAAVNIFGYGGIVALVIASGGLVDTVDDSRTTTGCTVSVVIPKIQWNP